MPKSKNRGPAWGWFSKYVRLKNADELGLVECFTCGKLHKWDSGKIHAGHYLKWGDHRNTRYNEINVQPQCVSCNKMKNGNDGIFRKKLVEKYGEQEINDLEIIAKSYKVRNYNKRKKTIVTKELKIKPHVLKELSKYYRLKFKELLDNANI